MNLKELEKQEWPLSKTAVRNTNNQVDTTKIEMKKKKSMKERMSSFRR